jgi:hypothetical protein
MSRHGPADAALGIIRTVGGDAEVYKYTQGAELKGADPYDETDPSPFTSNAINSSAYELASLTKHYLSSASTMSGIFKEVFTKPEFSMEDFLDHGYATVSGSLITALLPFCVCPDVCVPQIAGSGTVYCTDGAEADGDSYSRPSSIGGSRTPQR